MLSKKMLDTEQSMFMNAAILARPVSNVGQVMVSISARRMIPQDLSL